MGIDKSFVNILCLFLIQFSSTIVCNFVADFQSTGELSTDEWMIYNGKFPPLKEFSVCHWEKQRYFPFAETAPWTYCIEKFDNETTLRNCWQVGRTGDSLTANRHILVSPITPSLGDFVVKMEVNPYHHRKWNHFCWGYSSLDHHNTLYYNGKILGRIKHGKLTHIEGHLNVFDSAFIIGQEPDTMRGGYDLNQVFSGQIYELNMWNKILTKEEVFSMATCKSFPKGNVISWERQNFLVNKAVVGNLANPNDICEEEQTLVVFPTKMSWEDAHATCIIHGGKVIIPRSHKENDEIIKVLKKHRNECGFDGTSDLFKTGKAAWLGIKRVQSQWYEFYDGMAEGSLEYSNWDPMGCTSDNCGIENVSCPFIQVNGYWAYGLSNDYCINVKICAVCSIKQTPVFTLKGLCKYDSDLNWNYYFKIDGNHEIVAYDGYRTSKLIRKGGVWTTEDVSTAVQANTNFKSPLGRLHWNYSDRACNVMQTTEREMTLSRCEFGNEFTCSSGRCIDIYKRCDKNYDCDDNSDEDNCVLIRIPGTYKKVDPPKPDFKIKKTVPMITQLRVVSVDEVDTIHMAIGLTIDIKVTWKDDRLTFTNLDRNRKTFVPLEISNKLWLPLENIVHENAIIGTIIPDSQSEVSIQAITLPMPVDITQSYEDLLYAGSKNSISMRRRFRIKYKCTFDLTKFPFDRHICHIIMNMATQNNLTVSFAKDERPIIFAGDTTIYQFRITGTRCRIHNNERVSTFMLGIYMSRNYMNQMIAVYLPTLLLWFLCYSTNFIDIDNFGDRFMGTITALLVLVSLMDSVNEHLPRTSYFKYIDIWFLWYLLNVLFIILHHVVLSHIEHKETDSTTLVRPIVDTGEESGEINCRAKFRLTKTNVNKIAIVTFSLSTVLFNAVYFYLTI